MRIPIRELLCHVNVSHKMCAALRCSAIERLGDAHGHALREVSEALHAARRVCEKSSVHMRRIFDGGHTLDVLLSLSVSY